MTTIRTNQVQATTGRSGPLPAGPADGGPALAGDGLQVSPDAVPSTGDGTASVAERARAAQQAQAEQLVQQALDQANQEAATLSADGQASGVQADLELAQAKSRALFALQTDLPKQLEQVRTLIQRSGGDPARLAQAEALYRQALTNADQATSAYAQLVTDRQAQATLARTQDQAAQELAAIQKADVGSDPAAQQAKAAALAALQQQLPADLAEYRRRLQAAGHDPARIQAAQAFLKQALEHADAPVQAFGQVAQKAQVDAFVSKTEAQAAQEAAALEKEHGKAEDGNFVAKGFNHVVNFFDHKQTHFDDASKAAVQELRTDLPKDLETFRKMMADAGGDPAKVQAAQDFLKGAMAKADQRTQAFNAKEKDFKSSTKFWSGLAADVGAGLAVLGGVALVCTGVGAPAGAGLLALGAGAFVAGGALTVGFHAALDNQYDFSHEALGNFVTGGVSSAAMVLTGGGSLALTGAREGATAGGSLLLRQGVTFGVVGATTGGAGSFANEAQNGFKDGWQGRVALGTAVGAATGFAGGAIAGGIAPKLGLDLNNRLVQAGVGVTTGAATGGGGALVNEAIGGFQDGWQERVLQQTEGGAVAGGAYSVAPTMPHGAGPAADPALATVVDALRHPEVPTPAPRPPADPAGTPPSPSAAEPGMQRYLDANDLYQQGRFEEATAAYKDAIAQLQQVANPQTVGQLQQDVQGLAARGADPAVVADPALARQAGAAAPKIDPAKVQQQLDLLLSGAEGKGGQRTKGAQDYAAAAQAKAAKGGAYDLRDASLQLEQGAAKLDQAAELVARNYGDLGYAQELSAKADAFREQAQIIGIQKQAAMTLDVPVLEPRSPATRAQQQQDAGRARADAEALALSAQGLEAENPLDAAVQFRVAAQKLRDAAYLEGLDGADPAPLEQAARNLEDHATWLANSRSFTPDDLTAAYRRQLTQVSSAPPVHDPELKTLVSELYRSEVSDNRTPQVLGDGGAADALRFERTTGEQVGGRDHAQKIATKVKQLESWVRKQENPAKGATPASAEDVATAKALIADLKDALATPARSIPVEPPDRAGVAVQPGKVWDGDPLAGALYGEPSAATVGDALSELVHTRRVVDLVLPDGQAFRGTVDFLNPNGGILLKAEDGHSVVVRPQQRAAFDQANPGLVAPPAPVAPAVAPDRAPVPAKAPLPPGALPDGFTANARLLVSPDRLYDVRLPKTGQPEPVLTRARLIQADPEGNLIFVREDGGIKHIPAERVPEFLKANPGFAEAVQQAARAVPPLDLARLQDVKVSRGGGQSRYVDSGWQVEGVTPEGWIQLSKDADANGLRLVRDVTPEDFFATNPEVAVGDVSTFLGNGGLDALPRVANSKALAIDPREGAAAVLPGLNGEEGRVAVNHPYQKELLDFRMNELSPGERVGFEDALARTGTPTERVMIQRALAAGRSVPDIQAYAKDMWFVAQGDYRSAGIQDPNWARYLDQLSPDQRVLAVSTLEGLQQAFTTSCNPTSYQIVRGEYDPIYSWHGRLDPTQLETEQGQLLVQKGGQAVRRTPGAQGGFGSYPDAFERELNRLGLGLDFKASYVGDSPQQRFQALLAMEQAAKLGKPTELFVGWYDAQGNRNGGHAIAVLDARTRPDGTKQLLLHDPEFPSGPYTHWVDFKDIEAGNLGDAYGNRGRLEAYLGSSRTAPVPREHLSLDPAIALMPPRLPLAQLRPGTNVWFRGEAGWSVQGRTPDGSLVLQRGGVLSHETARVSPQLLLNENTWLVQTRTELWVPSADGSHFEGGWHLADTQGGYARLMKGSAFRDVPLGQLLVSNPWLADPSTLAPLPLVNG